MKVKNASVRDEALVVWRYADGRSSQAVVIKPLTRIELGAGAMIVGTYKLVTCTKLVDDPSIVEVEE